MKGEFLRRHGTHSFESIASQRVSVVVLEPDHGLFGRAKVLDINGVVYVPGTTDITSLGHSDTAFSVTPKYSQSAINVSPITSYSRLF